MRGHRFVAHHSSDSLVEPLFRSAWFWTGLLMCAYLISWSWLGDLVLAVPFVLLAAPSGLFHLLGIPEFKNGIEVIDRVLMYQVMPPLVLLSAHTIFWWALISLLCKRSAWREAISSDSAGG
jgi:hypothetical protein